MDAFHVVIDTSVLRKAHFQHPDFERLLRRSRKGTLRIYIPHIVLEEQRTHMLESLLNSMDALESAYNKISGSGSLGMFTQGLPKLQLVPWTKEEVKRNSRQAFDKFLVDNKIEKLELSDKHAARAWARYFESLPPFNPREERMNRRKDIPDSWILEAALEVKAKRGRHCALVEDGKLRTALEQEGFEIFVDVESLDRVIEEATAVTSTKMPAAGASPVTLDQLGSLAFKDVGLLILGVNEALQTPPKKDLFDQLVRVGVDRRIAEHEAQTLVLSNVLMDSGDRFIPVDRVAAQAATKAQVVTEALLKMI